MWTQNRTDSESAIDSPSLEKLDPDLDHDDAGDDDGEEDDDDHDSGDSVSSSPRRGKKKRDNSALRKAPQAPKRFKSSYICFFMAKQPEIKEELGDKATVTEISKRSAEMWRNLPASERGHWDEVAAKDKQRYLVEKASYTGPWQVPYKRAKKDPSAPKRPMSAFLYFSQGRRQQIKDKNPGIKNTEVSRFLGELWRNSTEEERRPFVEKEREEREKYKVSIADWRKDYEKKKEEQRQLEAIRFSHSFPNQPAPYGAQNAPDYITQYHHMPYEQSQGYAMPSSTAQQHYGHNFPLPPNPPQHYYPHQAPGPYRYPTNGKTPVILSPSGMPRYFPTTQAPPHYPPPPPDFEEQQGQLSHQQNFDYVVDQVSEPQTAE